MGDQEPAPEWVEWISGMAKLLAHPLRVRLLAGLTTEGPNSAVRFAEKFGDVSTEDCAYHLGVLRRGGAIKKLRTRHVRGAREVTYRFAGEQRSADAAVLASFLEVFGEKADWRDPNMVLPVSLDGRGLKELRKALEGAARKVPDIASASGGRLATGTDSREVRAVVRLAVIDQGGEHGS